MDAAARQFEELLATARVDPNILGVLLTGGRGKDLAFVREGSDYDVLLVVREGTLPEYEERFPLRHGDALEVQTDTVEGLRRHAAYGSPSEWARYSYAHVEALVDKLDGEIQRIVDEKARVSDEQRREVVIRALDAFVNSHYRSAKNRALGIELGARLDAAESLTPFLTLIFALEGRVRPYNKYLEWELRRFPLADETWEADSLLERVDRILGTGSLAQQQLLFRDVERVARGHGYGDVIDSWEPDVAWLRGDA
jgi:predicted nucleotidyltransferase